MSAQSIYTPYTYLIGWPELDTWYYGVRYAKECNPSDLWETYFTSSKHVHAFAEKNGAPKVTEIRKTFSSSEEAIKWESGVLRRLDVETQSKWLNKRATTAFGILNGPDNGMWGKAHTPETRLKISRSKKGLPSPFKGVGNDQRESLGLKPILGKPKGSKHSEMAKRKKSEDMRGKAVHPNLTFKGKTHSEEARLMMSVRAKESAKNRPKFNCPTCDVQIKGKMNWDRHLSSKKHLSQL